MPDPDRSGFAVGARLAARSHIRDIRTFALQAELIDFPSSNLLRYELKSDFNFEWDPSAQSFVVFGEYDLSIRNSNSDEGEVVAGAQEDAVANLSFKIGILYDLDVQLDEHDFSEDEKQAFAGSTAQFAAYPFARELVGSLTTRLGVPPLTLPILHVALDHDPTGTLSVGEQT